MQFSYCPDMSACFGAILNRIDAFFLSWHKFKNPIAVGIVLFNVQLSMNSHFPFPTLVESVVSQVLSQWAKR
jgi:hypothetical protein